MAGTFPLPEAQLDRFMMRVAIGYPRRRRSRCDMLRAQREFHPIRDLQPVMDGSHLHERPRTRCAALFVHESLMRYVQRRGRRDPASRRRPPSARARAAR